MQMFLHVMRVEASRFINNNKQNGKMCLRYCNAVVVNINVDINVLYVQHEQQHDEYADDGRLHGRLYGRQPNPAAEQPVRVSVKSAVAAANHAAGL